LDEAPLYGAIAQASQKFTVDAFTPCDVRPAGPGQPFSITSRGATKHFAAVQLDGLACPSFAGKRTVTPSQYKGNPAGNPPAAYGFPKASTKLGSPAERAAITNYVALSATHFPCMQYGEIEKLAATTEIPEGEEGPNGVIVPGVGLNLRKCTDGTSQTMMLCETIEPAMNCWYDGTTTWTTAINPNDVTDNVPTKHELPVHINPKHFWIVPDRAGGFPVARSALMVGPEPKETVAYSPALEGYCAQPQVISWGPSSQHAGGIVNHASVDGAVHAIKPDVDPTVYMWVVTLAGREEFPHPDDRD
jgi:hypothetical protein